MVITKEAWWLFERRCDSARRKGLVPWGQTFRLRAEPAPDKGEGVVALFPVDASGRRLTALGRSVYGRLTVCG